MYFTKKDHIEFIISRTKLQLKTLVALLLSAIIVTIVSFIGEYSYYQSIWEAKYLSYYSIACAVYIGILAIVFWGVRRQCQKNIPNIFRSKLLLKTSIYIITTALFMVVFLGRFYNNEIFFLSIINIVFGIAILLENRERAIFLVFHSLLYVIGSYLVLIDAPNLYTDIGKALSTNFLTFIIGKITYEWYQDVTLKSIKLRRTTTNQLNTLSYLAEELNLSKAYLEVEDNLDGLNLAIQKLIFEFSESKKKLSHTLELAKEASKAKEMFLANMSHEIRTPLNAIIGLLRELGKDDLNQSQKEYTKGASDAAKHLLNIVNNVLDMSKIESGEFVIKNEDFSLQTTIDNVISILQSQVDRKSLELKLELDPNISPAVNGDAQVLRQVLFNIIGNALKYTNEGTILVKAKVLEDSENFQTIELLIKDTGIGMKKDFLERVFDKFSQEHKQFKIESSGTGLGISITRELVQLSNGKISIESEENVGTAVKITFKYEKGNVENLYAVNLDIKSRILDNKNILLVDDDTINRIIARKTLESFGCRVVEAVNGQEAISQLMKNPVDLILMDIQMPIMNGLEATVKIRSEINSTIPIIALTANAFKNDIEKYLTNGMNDFITKPFEEITMYKVLLSNLSETEEDLSKSPAYDTSDFDSMDEDKSFTKQIITAFLHDLESLIPALEKILVDKDVAGLYQAVHKIKPSINILKIHHITEDVSIINNRQDKTWDATMEEKAKKILVHLKEVETQMKRNEN